MTTIIQATDLTKTFKVPTRSNGFWNGFKRLVAPSYDEVTAVSHINLTIKKGERVAYIGANGAGKSTTLKMLMGILIPTSGHVTINGIIPHQNRLVINQQIGCVFGQRSQLWWDLPVQASFRLLSDIYQIPKNVFAANMAEFTELLGLETLMGKAVRHMSLGQRIRCEFAASMLHDPSIIFLDEPTIGLDIAVKKRVQNFIRYINEKRQVTVILTSHDLDDIESVCERLIIIDKASIVYDGELQKIQDRFQTQSQLHLVFEHDIKPESLQDLVQEFDLTVLHRPGEDAREITLRYDKRHIATSQLIQQLSMITPIADLHTNNIGIESIIHELYEGSLKY